MLPDECRREMLAHCRDALASFHAGRQQEGKAFGLVFGKKENRIISVTRCFPLERNVRSRPPWREQVDRLMADYAVPSETPLAGRGWVADPAELFGRIRECRQTGDILLGTYHMHRVAWEHDPRRDTPTKLDAVLAKDSGLLMFIISMVDPRQPVIRVFSEGLVDRELSVSGA